jgi:UDP-N-acetylglucosamine--N-acetylmuramyl-(pentapeptide) pyrophosphoryl-undecaprenol N-acetylglucosamine transferase
VTTYLFAGGGTAGHVNPLLATADRLREREPDAEVLVLGTAEGLEARLVPERGYELVTVPKLPFPRRPNGDALRFPRRWRASVDRVRSVLRERRVDVVVGFGGYASAPAYAAARKERIPIGLAQADPPLPGEQAGQHVAADPGARVAEHLALHDVRRRGPLQCGDESGDELRGRLRELRHRPCQRTRATEPREAARLTELGVGPIVGSVVAIAGLSFAGPKRATDRIPHHGSNALLIA